MEPLKGSTETTVLPKGSIRGLMLALVLVPWRFEVWFRMIVLKAIQALYQA